MKHARCARVATRQRTHLVRDALIATFGAGLVALQVAAFSAALSTSSPGLVAAPSSGGDGVAQSLASPVHDERAM